MIERQKGGEEERVSSKGKENEPLTYSILVSSLSITLQLDAFRHCYPYYSYHHPCSINDYLKHSNDNIHPILIASPRYGKHSVDENITGIHLNNTRSFRLLFATPPPIINLFCTSSINISDRSGTYLLSLLTGGGIPERISGFKTFRFRPI
jgi:hypothetical protein